MKNKSLYDTFDLESLKEQYVMVKFTIGKN